MIKINLFYNEIDYQLISLLKILSCIYKLSIYFHKKYPNKENVFKSLNLSDNTFYNMLLSIKITYNIILAYSISFD